MSSRDIGLIKVAADYGPLVELLFSTTARRGPRGDLLFGSWWRQLPEDARRTSRLLAMFASCVPPIDLLTTTGPAGTIEQGIDALFAVRREVFQTELEESSPRIATASPAWVYDLPQRMEARRGLARELRSYYDGALAPHWTRIRSLVDSEAARYARVLATRGLHYFLNSLHPEVRWSPPVLMLTYQPEIVADLHPAGHGLLIVPSVFGRRLRLYQPANGCDSPITLIVPVTHSIAIAQSLSQPGIARGSRPLAALLGETRATVLEAASAGCTTTELARRARISPATASHHAAVLREAGLILSQRTGSAVLHTVTSLGMDLLGGVEVGSAETPRTRLRDR